MSEIHDIEIVFDDATITGRGQVAPLEGVPAYVNVDQEAERAPVVLVRIAEDGLLVRESLQLILPPGEYVITAFGLARLI